MKLRPPKKQVVAAWVEVYERRSWSSGKSPKEDADDLAQRLENVIADHTALKGWLGAQVRVETEAQCPECGKPYEPEKGGEFAGHCAWNGCDLRVFELEDRREPR